MEFKEFKISDMFEIKKGKSIYTNKYINENWGEFSVFSSQTTNNWEIGKINSYDFDIWCITWTTDWIYAGTTFLRENIKFSMTTHCWALILKEKYKEEVNLEYVNYYLSIYLKQYAIWNDNKRMTAGMISDLYIKLPIQENWTIDIKHQKALAIKYKQIEKIKEKLNNIKDDLSKKQILINNNIDTKRIKIKDILFSPPTNSWLKKIHVSSNNKDWSYLPVYSASSNEKAIFGRLPKTSKWKKYKNTLTRNKDGSSGVVFYRENEFIPYEKVKVLAIKDEYINLLDYNFLRIIIENQLLSFWYSFWTKCSMENVLNTEIEIPIDENWFFDIKEQKNNALKYEKLSKIQKSLVEELDYLENIRVEI